ncbi:MAG: nucleotidyltransferase domain-containing protein [Ignavibacteriaceae bacterium]
MNSNNNTFAAHYGIPPNDLKRIVEIIRQNKKVMQIILFGSRAKENYKNGSDIDLALIADNLTLDELLQIKINIDDLMLPYSFDIIDYKKISNEDLRNHIQRVGKYIKRR